MNDNGNEESAADILGLLDSVEICTQGFTHQSLNGVSEGSQRSRGGQGVENLADAMPPPSLPSRILHERTHSIAENSNIQITKALPARLPEAVGNAEAGARVSCLTQEQQLRIEEKRRAALARQAEQKRKLDGELKEGSYWVINMVKVLSPHQIRHRGVYPQTHKHFFSLQMRQRRQQKITQGF